MDMKNILGDILCGAIGYGIGRLQISDKQQEDLIHSFLKDCSLEQLIDFWIRDNGFTGYNYMMADRLRKKADSLESE